KRRRVFDESRAIGKVYRLVSVLSSPFVETEPARTIAAASRSIRWQVIGTSQGEQAHEPGSSQGYRERCPRGVFASPESPAAPGAATMPRRRPAVCDAGSSAQAARLDLSSERPPPSRQP